MIEITAVSIAPEEAWDCDHCGQKQTIAYLTDEDGDETFGYCEDCIGQALVASLKHYASQEG
jgi:hypothetical protein